MQADVCRPVSPRLNLAVNVQFCVFELRAPVHPQFSALRHDREGVVACALMVKGKIAQTNVCVNRRILERTGSLSGHIQASPDGHAAGLKLGNMSQIKVVSAEVEAEGTR